MGCDTPPRACRATNTGTAGGVQTRKLKGSAADGAKLLVTGRGLNLPDWLDAAPSVNDARSFKAKSP